MTISFKCTAEDESWNGTITNLHQYKNYFEIFIQSRSSIMVIFGKTSRGGFAVMPDFGVGCYLVDLKDKFWNTEALVGVLGIADGTTVAEALYALVTKLGVDYDFE